ncbi:hypothetical protein, partial [Pseudozobellia thermophila]
PVFYGPEVSSTIGFSYEQLRSASDEHSERKAKQLNFASTHQTENPRGFSEVGENKQLLIAILSLSSIDWYF